MPEGRLATEPPQPQPRFFLRLSPFAVEAHLEPIKGKKETQTYGEFEVSMTIGRRGLDERGFVVEVHELIKRVRDSFHPRGNTLGPQYGTGQRRNRVFVASCEQAALGVARVAYDMLGDDLADVTVSVNTRTGMATLEWKKGDPIPVFPKLQGMDPTEEPSDLRWTRHFGAFNVEVLIADNFRCGTPEGVDDSFRAEVSISRHGGLDQNGVIIDGDAFRSAVAEHFHPHKLVGTPEAPRTQGGSRVFIASCEALASGVAHVVHKMLGDSATAIVVSVQNATGMGGFVWKAGEAVPAFPRVADQAMTDRTYQKRQKAIREGRSASQYC